jgi:hypothetical protein
LDLDQALLIIRSLAEDGRKLDRLETAIAA